MSPLSGLDYYIVVAKIMFKEDWSNALKWLASKGYEMGRSSYYERIKTIDDSAIERLNQVALKFHVIAADEIVKFQNFEHEMYNQYHLEQSPINKARILKMIAELQPYITSLYDQTREVLEGKLFDTIKEDSILS